MLTFKYLRQALLMGVAAFGTTAAVSAIGQPACAQEITRTYNIQAQDLNSALREFALQTGRDVLYPPEIVAGKRSNGAQGQLTERQALEALLAGTGLRFEQTASNGYAVQDPASPTQLGAADTGAEEEIVVTGSRIRGATTGSPTQVYTQEDIRTSGAGTAQAFLETLPQNTAGGQSDDTTLALGANFSPNYAGANLRGIGNQGTLVLLNGRRLAPSGFGDFVDISTIPLNAVDRVEVLTDGSSAIYGSDAIGGVINYILRRDFDGSESSVRYAHADAYEEISATHTLGTQWGSGDILANVDYFERSGLDAADRSFTDDGPPPNQLIGPEERVSAFVSGRQELGTRLALGATGYYTHRVGEFTSVDGSGFIIQDTTTDNIAGVNLTATYDVGRTWRTEGYVAWSRADNETESVIATIGTDTFSRLNDVREIGIDADGLLANFNGGELRLAFGGSHRTEVLDSPSLTTDLERSVDSVYGELNAEFLPRADGVARLVLSTAVRHDQYDDFGDTTNPKFGFSWRPSPEFTLRGTYGTSFRAPQLIDLTEQFRQVFAFNFPSPTGVTPVLALFGGNDELQPETAEVRTLGFDFDTGDADGAFRISGTYWSIDHEDRISSLRDDPRFFAALLNRDVFGPGITDSPSPSVVSALIAGPNFLFLNLTGIPTADLPTFVTAIVDGRRRNFASTSTDGIDFSAALSWSQGRNEYEIAGNITQILSFESQISPLAPTQSRLDTLYNPVSTRARVSATVLRDDLSAGVAVNYTGDYFNNLVSPREPVDEFVTFDVFGRYEFRGTALNGVSINLSVNNVFDEDPPFVTPVTSTLISYDPTNASPLGRLFSVRVSKEW